MTEDELIKEIERRTQKAKTYVATLQPVIYQMFSDHKELFNKALPKPSSLRSTNIDDIHFAIEAYEYSLSHLTFGWEIARKDLRTDKSDVLLSSNHDRIDAFIDDEWSEDIIKFAAILHEALEPERIRQKQEQELKRQKDLHRKAQAFGMTSPFNFPEPPPAPSPTPPSPPKPYIEPIKPDTIYKLITIVLIIIFVIYFIARMY